MPDWYFGKPEIPRRALVLSFAALAVPVVATFWFREAAGQYELLLWLLALVPAFLLAYYRGWKGVAVAMAVGMAVLAVVQVPVITFGIDTDWGLLLEVVAAYVAIGLSIGYVTAGLHGQRIRAEQLAMRDDLTHIPNRRLAKLILEREYAAAQRGRPLAIVLFDLDHFKAFNDRHGHAYGDEALRVFVDVLETRTRRMDLSARYGGEEFLTILSGGSAAAGRVFAEAVRASLAEAVDAATSFTVSAGVAEFADGMASADALVAAADQALYQAKAAGRDRVAVFGTD